MIHEEIKYNTAEAKVRIQLGSERKIWALVMPCKLRNDLWGNLFMGNFVKALGVCDTDSSPWILNVLVCIAKYYVDFRVCKSMYLYVYANSSKNNSSTIALLMAKLWHHTILVSRIITFKLDFFYLLNVYEVQWRQSHCLVHKMSLDWCISTLVSFRNYICYIDLVVLVGAKTYD